MENRFIKVESTKILCDLTTANIRQPKAPRLGEVNGASRATENAVTTNTHPELRIATLHRSYNRVTTPKYWEIGKNFHQYLVTAVKIPRPRTLTGYAQW